MRGKRKRRDVAEFSVHLMDHILQLHQELQEGTYRHGGYQAFKLNDPKPRHIHKASVRDRLVHHAVYRMLYPYFDRKFIFDSYSCRNTKGTHRAIRRFASMARAVSHNHTRTCWVLQCDIRKFFASIDHTVLIDMLKQHIPDQRIMRLLENIIGSFQTFPGKGLPSTTLYSSLSHVPRSLALNRFPAYQSLGNKAVLGLPLGNLTSQLFVNVYMDRFDQFMKRELKVKHYIRYADDFVMVSEDKDYLSSLLPAIKTFLNQQVHLTLHRGKVSLRTVASGVDFLGWITFPHHRVLRTTTKRGMFRRLEEHLTPETVQSYLGLLHHGNGYSLQQEVVRLNSFSRDNGLDR